MVFFFIIFSSSKVEPPIIIIFVLVEVVFWFFASRFIFVRSLPMSYGGNELYLCSQLILMPFSTFI